MSQVDVVVPTIGRPSLGRLLDGLSSVGAQVFVVDDRRHREGPLPLGRNPGSAIVLPGRARGPASARNVGWRTSSAHWVAFLDDDVIPDRGWWDALLRDLTGLPDDVGGSQGRIRVPLPAHRRPTDRERGVAGLATARWVTADMAYRRSALAAVGGFDERFPRAYREDADLAARVAGAGWRLVVGERWVSHPVPPADRWISVRNQAGNADDVLLRVAHGRHWREVTAVGPGRRRRHLATTATAVAAVFAALTGRRKVAWAAAAGWLAATTEFSWARIAPGPRTPDEITTMVVTSIAIPPVATWQWLRGWVTLPRRLRRWPPVSPAAVLFDRDGTLVADVPHNGDPSLVVPMPGARRALDRLRAAGIPIAVVSNQSGMGRGLLSRAQVDAVNDRIEQLLGPLGPWLLCPHHPDAGCHCRKPRPGMVLEAAALLGVEASDIVVIGDIGADMEAARAAGARGILVPTAGTRPEEVAAATQVAVNLMDAVDLVLVGR